MIRTITANVESRKIANDLTVISWDDDKYGEPTEENILKALKDYTFDGIEDVVSNIEEAED